MYSEELNSAKKVGCIVPDGQRQLGSRITQPFWQNLALESMWMETSLGTYRLANQMPELELLCQQYRTLVPV